MNVRSAFGVFVISLLLTGSGYVSAADDAAPTGEEGEEESQKKEIPPEFPPELRLAPDRMPEPVRQNVLQRIDEHERLEELLRNQPLEIRQEKGTGD